MVSFVVSSVLVASLTGYSNVSEGSGIALSTSKGIVLAFDSVSIFQNKCYLWSFEINTRTNAIFFCVLQ
jgi:hypothetical protein